jgi:hypothetical protein
LPPGHFRVTTTDFTERFKREIGGLSPELKEAAKVALQHLKQSPPPAKLKIEKLKGYRNPSIYSIHITGNNSHKISFELQGEHAIMRRVATHKEIDRRP